VFFFFFFRLKSMAEEVGIECSEISIRRLNDKTGVINAEIPWLATNVKARIGVLKQKLVHLKKEEKSDNPDDYLFAVKSFYMLLRETWERLVEERVLNGVVERFNPGVSTLKFKKNKNFPRNFVNNRTRNDGKFKLGT